ncbi:hypothetical protein ANCCAN_02553 [Ancylostoma caninum]|uniref:Uncharacterized protein n=1 Tax=Ancylostoma caninum TaxID=29170 RepID=A0A368H7T2_ANCCA|nr:hypothetical protein ANCCAN_02553 [Ancylostoma caninum]
MMQSNIPKKRKVASPSVPRIVSSNENGCTRFYKQRPRKLCRFLMSSLKFSPQTSAKSWRRKSVLDL